MCNNRKRANGMSPEKLDYYVDPNSPLGAWMWLAFAGLGLWVGIIYLIKWVMTALT